MKRVLLEILLVIVCVSVLVLAFFYGTDPAGADYWTL